MLNDETNVTQEEVDIIEKYQKKPYRLNNAIFELLQNTKVDSKLKSIRVKLHYFNQCVFTNKFEELENREKSIEIYKTYSTDDLPIGWCALWLLELFAMGVMTILITHNC
jgi:hypothetical protein